MTLNFWSSSFLSLNAGVRGVYLHAQYENPFSNLEKVWEMQVAKHYGLLLQKEVVVVCFHETEIKADIPLSGTCNLLYN